MSNQKDFPLYPELTEQGKAMAQELMNKFERDIKEKAIEIIKETTSDFYCDVLHHIESDHWSNYRTEIVNALCDYSGNADRYDYDFKRIRQAIYKENKDEIIKDLNQDLLKEIDRLKERISDMQKLQRY